MLMYFLRPEGEPVLGLRASFFLTVKVPLERILSQHATDA